MYNTDTWYEYLLLELDLIVFARVSVSYLQSLRESWPNHLEKNFFSSL